MKFKSQVKRLAKQCLYGPRAYSDTYIDYLRGKGAMIGDGVTIHVPERTIIDETAPHLVTIGDYVNITGPATILTHDYSWSVVKGKTGEILGNQKPVVIGSNVFIGWGATILCGTTIEDNVIIGAHAVVSGHVEHDSVWGGVPARRICSLDNYREKRLSSQLGEAKEFVRCFRNRYGRDPREEEIPEYFMLFADKDNLSSKCELQMRLMGSLDKSRVVADGMRLYGSIDDFLRDVD